MISRRGFCQLAGSASLLAAWPGDYALAQPNTRERPDIGDLEPDSPIIASYRTAVAQMKRMPATDPRSWQAQAAIHNNSCPHGNWYFLPWHRAYVHAFETVVRDVSQNADFMLPFWDWSRDATMPAAFRNARVDGRDNTLFDGSRIGTVNRGEVLADATRFNEQAIGVFLAEADFSLFGSSMPDGQNSAEARWQRLEGVASTFEQEPHGLVHVRTGGNMSDVVTAARDPIFWLHHCNIDRVWSMWRARGNNNPTEAFWTDFSFNDFVDGGGRPRPYTVSQVLTTSALGYSYPNVADAPVVVAMAREARAERSARSGASTGDQAGPATMSARRPVSVSSRSSRPVETGRVSTVRLTLPTEVSTQARSARVQRDPQPEIAAARAAGAPSADEQRSRSAQPGAVVGAAKSQGSSRRVLATIRGIKPPPGSNGLIRVFVNCDYLTSSTPSTDSHHVATLSLFGAGHAGHAGHSPGQRGTSATSATGGGSSIVVDLTPALERQRRQGQPATGDLRVQLLGAQTAGAGAKGRTQSIPYDSIEVHLA